MFRIGEFSIIAQVSGRLLRYYDEIGLLSPDHTDPQTGYRFYSAGQLPRLNRILVLKELGLSLDQIARLLDYDTSVEELRGMLALRKAQIAQSMQEDLTRLQMVEARLDQIATHGQMQEPDVILKAITAQRYLALREVLPDIDAVRRLVSRVASVLPTMVSAGSLGQLAIVIHSPMFDPEAFDLEVGYLLTGKAPATVRLSEERVLTQQALPAVATMATVVHAGRVNDTHQSYSLLGIWAEQHQWQIGGAGRQMLMQLPQPGQDDAVIEVQLPVHRADENGGS